MALRVGYCQFRPQFGAPTRNLEAVEGLLGSVEADLVVLPELAFTGYHFANRAEALALADDPHDSAIFPRLAALARARRCHLVTGFAERRGRRLFNSAALVGPRGIEHVYRKLHLFNDEKRVFDAGDLPLSVQTVRGCRIGIMVCFDWAFPEVARTLALAGADLLCQPSNLVLTHCQSAMRTRSVENRVFTITANRTGSDVRPHGTLSFTGRSQVTSPTGELLVRAGARSRGVGLVDIDPRAARRKRITPRNDLLADRRPEFYGALTGARSSRGGTRR